MVNRREHKSIRLNDRFVIYYSNRDKSWLAHSLHTDQIGTGSSFMSAFADLLTGVSNLLALAKKDKNIAIYREAPKAIQKRAEKAKPLPGELVSMALKRLSGDWPRDIRVAANKRRAVRVDIALGDFAKHGKSRKYLK